MNVFSNYVPKAFVIIDDKDFTVMAERTKKIKLSKKQYL